MMRRNASDADYVPIAAIARYIGVHRDTIYEAAKGVAVERSTQIRLSHLLIRHEAGELEVRQADKRGLHEIYHVANPKPRLRFRVALNFDGTGHRITALPYQPPPRFPSFASVFDRG